MEKFGLLNLLKAIDGLNSATTAENNAAATQQSNADKPAKEQTVELPNFMYETLMRHEAMSNRLRNRKKF